MYFAKRRQDWKLGRWTAKQAVLGCLKQESVTAAASRLEIIAAPDGAPEAFLDGERFPISLSISHSADAGICALGEAGWSLGCDLEEIRPHEDNFVVDYFTHDEMIAVEKARPEDHDLLITLVWSAKESALKALRQGLRRDTRSVQVSIPGAGQAEWQPLTAHDLEVSRVFHGWWRAQEGRVLTIAADVSTAPPLKVT